MAAPDAGMPAGLGAPIAELATDPSMDAGVIGNRLERLRRSLIQRRLDGALILSPPNVRYLAAGPAQDSNRALLITGTSVLAAEPSGSAIARMLVEAGAAPAAFGSDLVAASGPGAGMLDLSGAFASMRRVKDEAEIAAIRIAATCVDLGLEAARAAIRAGIRDTALVEVAREAILGSTSLPVEFDFNIGVGSTGTDPDATSCDAVVAEGDAVFLDLYPRIGTYFADATRTFCTGDPEGRVADIVGALWAALDAGAALLRPGVRAADIDARCRAELEARGMPSDYPHHTGHGVGLEQQERPWIVPGSADVLVAGDVVALEPGIYADGIGARVENLYIVRPDGPELVSRASRSLRAGRSIDG